MEILSKRYGWTPNQIREMSFEDVEGYLDIIRTKNLLDSIEIKKMKRK